MLCTSKLAPTQDDEVEVGGASTTSHIKTIIGSLMGDLRDHIL